MLTVVRLLVLKVTVNYDLDYAWERDSAHRYGERWRGCRLTGLKLL